jgi:hypothetical protein
MSWRFKIRALNVFSAFKIAAKNFDVAMPTTGH